MTDRERFWVDVINGLTQYVIPAFAAGVIVSAFFIWLAFFLEENIF